MLNNEKYIIVTGGDKGIGRGIVEVLSEENYNVLFTYKDNIAGAMELQNSYPHNIAIQCDFSNIDSIQQSIKKIKQYDLNISGLINNVGIDKDKTFQKMEYEDWYTVINVNLINMYYYIKIFSKHMIDGLWGRIINISSIGAFYNSYGKSNYAASKSGMIGLTKSLALQFAKYNITVNCICPGAFDTDMFNRIPDKYKEQILNDIPMKRLGTARQVGHLISFLLDDKAQYITGQTIHINGGLYLG